MMDNDSSNKAEKTEVQSNVKTEAAEKTFKEFLETHPPGGNTKIKDLWRHKTTQYGARSILNTPDHFLHCTHKDCNGARYFRSKSAEQQLQDGANSFFVWYQCSNCNSTNKRYSLLAIIDTKSQTQSCKATCEKYGEVPAFGPQTSAKLLRLFGNDREIFLKGRRCETQGLGVGAYAYYRRIVENHKDSIFAEIIKVCEKISATPEIISMLNSAKNETQFTSALDKAKDAIPATLLINGHNPLTLLHSALSEGLHANSDAQCLELANDIRIVLTELANRLGQALNDDKEMKDAVHRLLSRTKTKPVLGT
jgi:hypothetical protein